MMTANREQPANTLLGPGDDAALVVTPDCRTVATTDMLVQGVHFRLDWSSPELVGRKAIAVNLADIAAMGATPTGVLVAIGCPGDTPTSVLKELTEGMWTEASSVGIGLVGGDLVRAEQLTISVTALGDLAGRDPVTRSGARPGDILAICGRLGWAAAGLAVLGRGFRSPVGVVNAQRVPEPPYAAGPSAAAGGATSMTDVSDGLLADLGHIAEASGVGFDVHTSRLLVDQKLVEVGAALGADPLRWVLTGGEDYALVATFPSFMDLPKGWTRIGSVTIADSGITVDGEPYQHATDWQHWQ
jgi:thiamine-monophosphate kinase